MKKVKVIILLLLIASFGFGVFRILSNPNQSYPYPYTMGELKLDEITSASKADVLIIGDSAGVYIAPFLEDFKSQTSNELKRPLKIFNWARKGETLAHSLKKVQSLLKMPLLIIYHAGLDEMDHARFQLEEVPKILKNISITKNDSLMSSILSAPIIGRLLFWPHKRPQLNFSTNDILSPLPSDLPPKYALKSLEVIYEVYSWEAKEFFSYLKLKDANVWFIPQAYNLKVPPSRTCESASDSEIDSLLKQASNLIVKGKTKEAFSIVNSILTSNKTHARALYTMGNLFMKRGDFSSAKRAYYQSMIYDCGLRRANPLLLKILMEEAEKKDFTIIDFNRSVTNFLGKNLLFQDLRQPQSIYYKKLIEQLVGEFRRFIRR